MVEKEKSWAVVSELPQSPIRVVEGSDGKDYELLTANEALKEILQIVRDLKKGLTG